ncbi:MAG: PAS domain-containing protein [Phycisphaerales bacterium]|nr:MAG: PAS domain-containing protein [Phycisphaerales bacterium]
MRFKSLYVIITLVVVCSLLTVGLISWRDPGDEQGPHAHGFLQQIPIRLVCCITLAVGVILLGWFWLRLAAVITSIAELIADDTIADACMHENSALSAMSKADELHRAIADRFLELTTRVGEYAGKVKDLQLQIQLSQKRTQNTEAIIYSLRDAVIVVDEFDKLLMANEAAGRLFDFDFRQSQHKHLGELIREDKREFADFLSRSKQSKGQATRQEIEFMDKAERRTFDCIVSCVYDQDRKVCGAVAVLHDITREKEISQMKNDFVGHVSHELKTPLASITAYSEMLVDGEAGDEETRKEFYSIIQKQAKRLNRLIEDILNTSRIESGLIKINKEPISLTILIEEQLQMIKSYAEEKNITVTGQKPIVFDQVEVDRDMISQVVVNLLSNAVKYTPAGGSVKVETNVDETASLVRVTITDTGVGIPADEIEHVFDKFYRVGANKKQAKGTGLGLNLVKQIVEKLHDGRVFVTSRVGEGSTFGFELPLATKNIASVT